MKIAAQKTKYFLLFLFLSLQLTIFAEVIKLKNGKSVEAQIMERTDKNIKVDIAGIPVIYYLDEIESINGEKITSSLPKPNKESEQKAATDDSQKYKIPSVCSEEAKKYVKEGLYYKQQQRFQEAIGKFEEALKIDPACIQPYMLLTDYYIAVGKYKEAIEINNRAIKNIPDQAWAFHNTIAAIYFAQKDYEKAINTCKETLKLFPNNGYTYYTLGRIYCAMGNYNDAKPNLQKALQIANTDNDKKLISETEKILKAIP